MKRSILFLLAILCLASLACKLVSGTGSTSTPTPAALVATATEISEATEAVTEAATELAIPEETATLPENTATPQATEAPAATATLAASPTPQASPTASGVIQDPFDEANQNWTKPVIVTTQSNVLKSTFKVIKGHLVYDILDKETYVYQFNKTKLPADVSVEVTYLNQGELNNAIVLTCRTAPDNSAWYEVRVGTKGEINFYRYDRALKADGGQNPYVDLGYEAVNFKTLYPDKPNVLKFSCKGETLTLDINKGLRVFTASDSFLKEGGLTGLGVVSHEDIGISIAFDEFKAAALP